MRTAVTLPPCATTPPGSGNAAAADQVGLRKEDEEVPAKRCENKTGEDQQPVGGVCGQRDQRKAATEEMFTFEWPPHRNINYKLTIKCIYYNATPPGHTITH